MLLIISFLAIRLFTITIKTQEVSAYVDLREEIMENRLEPTATEHSGYADANKNTIINALALVINSLLALLGIVFLVLIIISGYQWMMAGGNEETITTAKNRIKNATIGLAIVLFSYTISYYIFMLIEGASTGAETAI